MPPLLLFLFLAAAPGDSGGHLILSLTSPAGGSVFTASDLMTRGGLEIRVEASHAAASHASAATATTPAGAPAVDQPSSSGPAAARLVPDGTKVCFVLMGFGPSSRLSHGSAAEDLDLDAAAGHDVACLAPGLSAGFVPSLGRGFHKLGAFLADARDGTPVPGTRVAQTTFQVLQFDEITVTVWSESQCGQGGCPRALFERVTEILGPAGGFDAEAEKTPAVAATAKSSTSVSGEERDNPGPADRRPAIVVHNGVLDPGERARIEAIAMRCDYNHSSKDSIDKQPAYQRDLWNHKEGLPVPNAASLQLTAAVIGTMMPRLVSILGDLGWAWDELTCIESFVRRYQPNERGGVVGHTDHSDITVNCLLSADDAFAGGMPYRWTSPTSAEVIPVLGGGCVIHPGPMTHGALPTTHGVRYVAIFFWKILADRGRVRRERRAA